MGGSENTSICTGRLVVVRLRLVAALACAAGAAPAWAADFAARCAAEGVIKCVGFDSPAEISGGYGDRFGIFSGATTPSLDSEIKASGASSLKFTIPSNSPADTSGSYFTNFSNDLSARFGENQEFYVQWRQRFSPEFLAGPYAGGGGWKQAIIGTGDALEGPWYASCTALETVLVNTYHRGFAQMYNSCTGSASHGPFDGFEEPFGSFDFKLQNARPAPYCLYSQAHAGTQFPPSGNCFGYFPNEWLTFQVRIKTGPRVGDEFTNSFVTLWIARADQPSQLAIEWGPYSLTAGGVWLYKHAAASPPAASALAMLAAAMAPRTRATFTTHGLGRLPPSRAAGR